MSAPRLVVAGSVNLDLVVRTARFPAPGETLTGAGFATYGGGKGANQAVAAARLGARVAFVGAVGDDPFGAELRAGLAREGLELDGLAVDAALPSGVAVITVRRDGENQIVVAPGANAALDAAAVAARLPGADALLLQLEVPLTAVIAAARAAREAGVRTVLNAAPARDLPGELLAGLDVLVVNRVEAAQLAGGDAEPAALAERLLARGVRAVVLTLGADGAMWRDADGLLVQRVEPVEVVDTTGAGDAFCGALATRLAEGASAGEALRFACAAGALACAGAGAQPALPRRAEVDARLRRPPA